MKPWSKSQIHQSLQDLMINEFQFPNMTHVQAAAIEHFKGNKDVCVEACTGSGKTLTFLLPTFHKLLTQDVQSPYALIIAPSRELAQQIYEVASKINQGLGNQFGVQCFIGGHSLDQDLEKLREALHLIIGTPGRLWEIIEQEAVSLKNIEILILDEADRLLDLDYDDKVNYIVDKLPRQRRTGLFSATMTTKVEGLIKAGLRNPVYISVKVKSITGNQRTIPEGLTNFCIMFSNCFQKLPALVTQLKTQETQKTIVFLATCASTNYYHFLFQKLKFLGETEIFRLHGKMKQSQRESIFQKFEEAENGVLFTTDLCARGIDFNDIDWIIQYDPPSNPDFFIHRIGRTARAGKTGKTLVFLLEKEDSYIEFLQLRNIELQQFNIDFEVNYNIYDEIRQNQLKCREIYERAQKAFVAYIRFYKEHRLNFIFQFKDLDIGYLAQSLSLFRLPRITEIIGKNVQNFQQSDIDPDTISYEDKHQEKKRIAQLQAEKERKAKILADKQKRKNLPQKRQRTKSEKRHTKHINLAKEWKEMGEEERIIKKIKRGNLDSEEVQQYIQDNPSYKKLFRRKKKSKR